MTLQQIKPEWQRFVVKIAPPLPASAVRNPTSLKYFEAGLTQRGTVRKTTRDKTTRDKTTRQRVLKHPDLAGLPAKQQRRIMNQRVRSVFVAAGLTCRGTVRKNKSWRK